MHRGVFKGDNIPKGKRVLVLGESHHHKEKDYLNYTTEYVVKKYLKNPNDASYRFFDKIVNYFGYDNEKRELLWNKVYFGNFVDESNCGIGDSKAKNYIRENQIRYNDELFEFINDNDIDIVCCFSRLVYNSLPSKNKIEGKNQETDVGTVGGKRDYISRFVYNANVEHKKCSALLNKNLVVYGFRHPSAQGGFNCFNYTDFIKENIEL